MDYKSVQDRNVTLLVENMYLTIPKSAAETDRRGRAGGILFLERNASSLRSAHVRTGFHDVRSRRGLFTSNLSNQCSWPCMAVRCNI